MSCRLVIISPSDNGFWKNDFRAFRAVIDLVKSEKGQKISLRFWLSCELFLLIKYIVDFFSRIYNKCQITCHRFDTTEKFGVLNFFKTISKMIPTAPFTPVGVTMTQSLSASVQSEYSIADLINSIIPLFHWSLTPTGVKSAVGIIFDIVYIL
jgi:hypothetical protein